MTFNQQTFIVLLFKNKRRNLFKSFDFYYTFQANKKVLRLFLCRRVSFFSSFKHPIMDFKCQTKDPNSQIIIPFVVTSTTLFDQTILGMF